MVQKKRFLKKGDFECIFYGMFKSNFNGIFDLRKNEKSAGKTAKTYFLICCRAIFADHFPPGFAYVAQF